MRTIIELLAYCVAAGALTILGDIWITELLYRYRLRNRSPWGLANGFSVLDVKNLESRLDMMGRPGVIGQTTRGAVLSGLQAPDVQVVDYTYLVRDYRGGSGGGLSARRATTLLLTELQGRVPSMEVLPKARKMSARRLFPKRRKTAASRVDELAEAGFEGKFQVISGDGAVAGRVLAPPARAAMLERPRTTFELGGRYLVADEGRLLFGDDLLAAIATIRRLRDALPSDDGAATHADASATTIWSRLRLPALAGEAPWRRGRPEASG